MGSYGFVVPILPDQVEPDRQLAAELNGARRAEFEASRARLGITREEVWIQETPMGAFAVVHLEADDVMAAIGGLGTSQDPCDRWWRSRILEIHGLDLSQPPSSPPNEKITDFRRG